MEGGKDYSKNWREWSQEQRNEFREQRKLWREVNAGARKWNPETDLHWREQRNIENQKLRNVGKRFIDMAKKHHQGEAPFCAMLNKIAANDGNLMALGAIVGAYSRDKARAELMPSPRGYWRRYIKQVQTNLDGLIDSIEASTGKRDGWALSGDLRVLAGYAAERLAELKELYAEAAKKLAGSKRKRFLTAPFWLTGMVKTLVGTYAPGGDVAKDWTRKIAWLIHADAFNKNPNEPPKNGCFGERSIRVGEKRKIKRR